MTDNKLRDIAEAIKTLSLHCGLDIECVLVDRVNKRCITFGCGEVSVQKTACLHLWQDLHALNDYVEHDL